MIDNILNALVRFRVEATPDTFKRIFGPVGALHLWVKYHGICKCDLVSFYAYISPTNRTLFEAYLAAQLPPTYFDSPHCVECGGELSESDIEAGDACGHACVSARSRDSAGVSANVCLDCAASIVLERDAEASGSDADGIDYEPGALLATARVGSVGRDE